MGVDKASESEGLRKRSRILTILSKIPRCADRISTEERKARVMSAVGSAIEAKERVSRLEAGEEDVVRHMLPSKRSDWCVERLNARLAGKLDGAPAKSKPGQLMDLPNKSLYWRYNVKGMSRPTAVAQAPQSLIDWTKENPAKVTVQTRYLDTVESSGIGVIQACTYADHTILGVHSIAQTALEKMTRYQTEVRKIVRDKLPSRLQSFFPTPPDLKETEKWVDALAFDAGESMTKALDLAWYQVANARLVKRDLYIDRLPSKVPTERKEELRTAPIDITNESDRPRLFDPKTVREARTAEKEEIDREVLIKSTQAAAKKPFQSGKEAGKPDQKKQPKDTKPPAKSGSGRQNNSGGGGGGGGGKGRFQKSSNSGGGNNKSGSSGNNKKSNSQ